MKREMRELILIVLLLLPGSLIAQTSYYVSSSEGNDSNPGTTTGQPWKSLEKVNSFKPQAGDKILFKRGDEWVGTLTPTASGSAGNPITYGAYGAGDKPKIYGSKEITGWTVHKGNIYKAKVLEDINQLFLDGERIQLARIPKTGYYDVTSVNSTTQFSSNELPSVMNYTGAKAIIRTNRWGMATKTVMSSSSQTLTVNSPPQYTITVGDGFFLNNKIEFLTAAGEYYYDQETKTVYLWAPNNDNPANYEVRGSSLENLVTINYKNYVALENIELAHSSGITIKTDYCNYLTFDKLDIINPDSKGVYINHDKYGTYQNIAIEGANHIAFHAQFTSYSNIVDNTITNTALFDNLGLTGMGGEQDGRAILGSAGTDNVYRYNKIENTAYSGLTWRTPNTIIDKNFIKNACLVKDDGGAIYSWSSNPQSIIANGSEVTNNIILNTLGSSDGTSANYPQAYGIYLDNNIREVTVGQNTIYNSSGGIFLNSGNGDNIIHDNTVIDADILFVTDVLYSSCTIINNIFYAAKRVSSFTWWSNDTQRLVRVKNSSVKIDNNKYVHHYSANNLFNDGQSYLAWSDWKSAMSGDANSSIDLTPLANGEVEELFYNDTKQTKEIDLGGTIYRDLDGNEVSGSISLEPFTSKILIRTTKETSTPVNKTPEIPDQSFEITSPKNANDLIGQVIANDPDAGQELTYSIVEGNEENLFSVEALTGELVANASIPATTDQTITLTVQVTDNASTPLSASAQITIVIRAIETASASDTTPPTIASFSVPATYSALTIPISEFTAMDNTAIAGYQLTETSTPPTTDDSQWTTSAPEAYTFSEEGTHTLYAWAKDEAGNISPATSRSVSISLPDLSPTFSEYLFEEPSGETVIDSQGSNDGIIQNETLRVDGVNGDGLQLTGSGYISLGNSFGANVQNELTLSAWILPQSTTTGYQGIIMHGGPNVDSYALYIHPGNQSISFKTSGTTSAWTSIPNISGLWDGNWHHVAVTYDGSKKTIYLDDEILLTVDANGAIDSGEGYNLLIGAGRDDENPTLLYEGLIDEVRIYNTALTSSEIGELYNRVTIKPNQSPVIQTQSFEITEPKAVNDLIGKIIASDPDVDQQLNYAIIEGNTAGLFAIHPETGEIFANVNLPASADQTITLLVKVTDNHQEPLSSSAAVTISIQAIKINQSPVVQNLNVEVEGNLKVNDLIGKIVASDPDGGQLLTYTITGGNEAGLFKINPETGEIYAAADFITTTDQTIILTTEVRDNATEPLTVNATATINITGIQLNQSPVAEDQTIEIQNDIQINDFILKVVASDPDAGQKLSYSIIQGNEAGLFKINPETGDILANAAISSAIDQSFSLVVQVTDNAENPLSAHANITIISLKIAEINKQPVAQNLTVEIDGNFAVNDWIGKIVASDPDAGQQLTYTITGGNEEGLFKIDPGTGEIRAAVDFITTTDQTVVLTVEVKDNATESLATSVNATINITGIQLNQSPMITDQTFEINGDIASNEFIGQILASDPDAGQKLSYSISQGNEAGFFKLNPETGEIFTNQSISVSSAEILTLVVEITDDHQIPLSAHANVTVYITPALVNQSPVIYDQSFDVRKNDKLGDMIGQVVATDPDTEQGLTFSILSGNEEGVFTIDPATGGLYTTEALLLNSSETILLEVEVTDNAPEPLSASAYISIHIVINGKIVDGEVKSNNPKRIILSYSEPLKTDNLKSSQISSDFTLSDGNVVRHVSIKGNEIYLDLESKYDYDDEIIVSYSRGSTPIYDASGNEMEPFDNYEVTNNVLMGNDINFDVDPTANALDVVVYPNPSDGQINIRANNLTSDDCELFLFSMTGNLVSKKLISGSFGNLEERLNLSHLNKGTYIIKLISKRQIFQEKIVIM